MEMFIGWLFLANRWIGCDYFFPTLSYLKNIIYHEFFYAIWKPPTWNSYGPCSSLLEGSSESENHVSFGNTSLRNTNPADWCWTLEFRGGGVSAFLACAEHLLSQPHQERQLLEGVQVLSRSGDEAKEGSWLLVILMGWNGKWEALTGMVSWHKIQPLNYGLAPQTADGTEAPGAW